VSQKKIIEGRDGEKVKNHCIRLCDLNLNPLTSYVLNLSRPKLCSFILHTVIFITQRPLSWIRPKSHFLFKHFIAI